jgi:hypothetical protein
MNDRWKKELGPLVKQAAIDTARRGAGYAQQSVAIAEVQSRLRDQGVSMWPREFQLRILDEWHALFRQGVLVWGVDLDNPGPPFFHVASESE